MKARAKTPKRLRGAARRNVDRNAARQIVALQHALEIGDLAGLPGEFRAFRAEQREANKDAALINPTLVRIEESLTDLRGRVHDLEQDKHRTHERLAILESRKDPTP